MADQLDHNTAWKARAKTWPFVPRTIRRKLRDWRTRKIADPRFRRLVERFWLTRPIANHQANELFKITAGFVYSQILSTCIELRIFSMLEKGSLETRQIHKLVRALKPNIPEKAVRRILEAAENLKLLMRLDEDIWALDDLGAVIANDEGIRAMVAHHSMLYRDLSDPVSLIAGEKQETEIGRYWAYANMQSPEKLPPDQVSAYSILMQHSQEMIAEAVITEYAFGRHKHVLDIGGGNGTFLAHLHTRHPDIVLSLFDLPSVTQDVQENFKAGNPGARIEIQGGDFFHDKLNANADLYTLIRICCDHDDDAVLKLLANIHNSMKTGAKLLIGEAMSGKGAGERLASAYFKLYFSSMGSGECRTPAHLQSLLAEAGFSSSKYRKTSNPLIASIIVAEK